MSPRFEDFYEREWERSVRATALLVGSRAGAEDIVHDAMIGLYRRWHRVEQPQAYLRRAVLNRAFTWMRKERRMGSLGDYDEAAPEEWTPIGMAQMLANLMPRQRAALVMKYYEGLSDVEISEALDCRPGTVGPLLTRARRQLKEELAHGE